MRGITNASLMKGERVREMEHCPWKRMSDTFLKRKWALKFFDVLSWMNLK